MKKCLDNYSCPIEATLALIGGKYKHLYFGILKTLY